MKLKQMYLLGLLLCLFISLQMIFVNKFAKAESFQHSYSNTIFKPPKDGSPDDTTGAGSRETGSCAEDQIGEGILGFMALMPKYIETSDPRPTFSVYIPQTVAKKIFFSIKDANENYYYQTIISLPGKPGKFSFQLPNDAPVIESDREYTWYVGLICQTTFDPNDPTLQGVIRRIIPTPNS